MLTSFNQIEMHSDKIIPRGIHSPLRAVINLQYNHYSPTEIYVAGCESSYGH